MGLCLIHPEGESICCVGSRLFSVFALFSCCYLWVASLGSLLYGVLPICVTGLVVCLYGVIGSLACVRFLVGGWESGYDGEGKVWFVL